MKQVEIFEDRERPNKLTDQVNLYLEELYADNLHVIDIVYQTTHYGDVQWYSAMIIYDKDMSNG